LSWIDAADEGLLYLSVLTLGELRKGIAALPASKRRVRLESWFQVELRGGFSGHILPINLEIADRWGLIAARAKKLGRPLSVIDGLLPSQFGLGARNAADVAHVAVQLINPCTS
jgi:toxin FitB